MATTWWMTKTVQEGTCQLTMMQRSQRKNPTEKEKRTGMQGLSGPGPQEGGGGDGEWRGGE